MRTSHRRTPSTWDRAPCKPGSAPFEPHGARCIHVVTRFTRSGARFIPDVVPLKPGGAPFIHVVTRFTRSGARFNPHVVRFEPGAARCTRLVTRSEERRVGRGGESRWWTW